MPPNGSIHVAIWKKSFIILPNPVTVVSIMNTVGPTMNTNANNKNDNQTLTSLNFEYLFQTCVRTDCENNCNS